MKLLLTIALAGAPALAIAQNPAPASWDSTAVEWDEGRFAAALERMERVLSRPGGEAWLDSVALLTGERWRTSTVAPVAHRVMWSGDGRFVAVEHGARFAPAQGGLRLAPFGTDSVPRLSVYRLDGDTLAKVLDESGYAAAFVAPDRLVFLRGAPGAVRLWLATASAGVREVPLGGLDAAELADGGSGRILVTARAGAGRSDIFRLSDDGRVDTIAAGPGQKAIVAAVQDGAVIVYRSGAQVMVRDAQGTRGFAGVPAGLSADGSRLLFWSREGETTTISTLELNGRGEPVVVKRGTERFGAPALSPDGRLVAFQQMIREDWELFVMNASGGAERRLSTDIQHDQAPLFLRNDLVLGRKGEPRHTRSYLYDLTSGAVMRLFHNNTVRTVSMEWGWYPAGDGRRLLVSADRDGDSFSPERGLYLVDLGAPLGVPEVLARVRAMRADEAALAERGRRLYASIAPRVRAVTSQVSEARVRRYQEALSQFGSRDITLPGNQRAIAWIEAQLRAMGWEPEVQWFEPRPGVRSANIVVTLRGTAMPDAVHVVSSHLDSVEPSPGADDNGAGTTALLEVARVLVGRPQPATIKLVWVTGEERGLLGSREFVRREKAAGTRIVTNLNNDTFAWTRMGRPEATVRFSNPFFRDVQHGAAAQFTQLVTFEARMFQSSDGRAFFDEYGDIVGGFGSYPILASPHYHQSHDAVETVGARTIAEVARATTASLMLLATRGDWNLAARPQP